MTKISFSIFFFIILLCIPLQGQHLETNVEGISINGHEYEKSYQVFVLSNGKWMESKRTDSGFIVPSGLSNEKRVNVRFVFDKYSLIFPAINVSEFDVKWFVGVYDKPPFPTVYLSNKEGKSVARIYFIQFTTKSGQEIIQLIKEKRKPYKLRSRSNMKNR